MQLGLRQARYVGRSKTLFQLAMASAVANLVLMARGPFGLWSVILAFIPPLLARTRLCSASDSPFPQLPHLGTRFFPTRSFDFRLPGWRPGA